MSFTSVDEVLEKAFGTDVAIKFFAPKPPVDLSIKKDEDPSASKQRVLEAAATQARTRPIFRVPDEQKELATALGGKQLVEGAWFYGFGGVLGEELMAQLIAVFGIPRKPEDAKRSTESYIRKLHADQQRTQAQNIVRVMGATLKQAARDGAAVAIAQASKGRGGTGSNRGGRGWSRPNRRGLAF